MKLSEIARTIARLSGRRSDEIHARLRNPSVKSLLHGEPGRGRTSAANYPPRELARARLMVALGDCGLTAAEMQVANDILERPPSTLCETPDWARSAGYVVLPAGLDCVIRGADAGEDWQLKLRFTVRADGTRRVVAWLEIQPKAQSAESDASALDLLTGETHVGTLSVPATALVAPLLDHLR